MVVSGEVYAGSVQPETKALEHHFLKQISFCSVNSNVQRTDNAAGHSDVVCCFIKVR